MSTEEQNELYRMEIWFSRYAQLRAKAEAAGILAALEAAAETQAAISGPEGVQAEAPPPEPAPPADPVMALILGGR